MNKRMRENAVLLCPGPWYRVVSKSETIPYKPLVVLHEHPSRKRCEVWCKSRYKKAVIGVHLFIEAFNPETGAPEKEPGAPLPSPSAVSSALDGIFGGTP